MSAVLYLCLAILGSACAQQVLDDGDDGSYNAEKYESPYDVHGVLQGQQPQGYQQRAYQPQYQGQPQAQYQPQSQPQYRQQADPKTAAILSDARYLNGDGKFGASYTQEDGVEFKEESDPDGTRRGTYSYVDPTGQRRTVSYTAGKNGFQASGAHLPVGPAGVPAPAPAPVPAQRAYQQPQAYPAQQYQQPQYQPQPQAQPQPQYTPQQNYQQPATSYQSTGPQTFPQTNNGGYNVNF